MRIGTPVATCVESFGENQRAQCMRPEIQACDGNLILTLDASGNKLLICNSEAQQEKKKKAAEETPPPARAPSPASSSAVPTWALAVGGVAVIGVLGYLAFR